MSFVHEILIEYHNFFWENELNPNLTLLGVVWLENVESD